METPEVVYVMFSGNIQELEGRMLTYLEAIIPDAVQRKASKDLLRPMIWEWAIRSNFADACEVKRNIDGKVLTNQVSQGVSTPSKTRK